MRHQLGNTATSPSKQARASRVAAVEPGSAPDAADNAVLVAADVRRATRVKRLEQAVSLCSPVLLLLVWELLVRGGLLDRRFFPAPTSIVGTFGGLIASGELPLDLRDTLGRLVVGLALGAIPGLLLGGAMGLSSWLRAFLKPMVAALFPIPKIAILPLIMLIFGLGEVSKYVSIAIGLIFLMLINTMAGVMNIEKIYLDVGRNFGASRWQFFTTIAIPGAMPMILAGLQLSVGVALISVIAIEFITAQSGVGHLIWQSWQTFSVAEMYCGLVVTAILGFAAQLLLDGLQRLLMPWRPGQ
jgi:NitT/TauT family transport system permease protein